MIFPRPGNDRVNIQFAKRIKQETGEFVKKTVPLIS